MFYLDTSVLVALYIPEPKSIKIQKFANKENTTAISSLTEVEFNSAISRRVRMKEISCEDGYQIISHFQLHVKNDVFEICPVMQREYDLARTWISSFETSLRTLDALHLGVVFSNNLQLVTSDNILAKSARKIGVKTKTI